MPDDRLTGSMQESLLTCLAFSEDKRVTVLTTLDPKYFEPPYDDIASRLIEFRSRFDKPAGREHIDDVFDHVLGNPSDRRHQLYSRLLTGMIEQAEGINVEYVVKRVRDFVRRQKLKAAIIEAGHLYESQATKDTLADDVEAILAAALRDKLDDYDVGTFMDQEKALAFLEQNENDFMPMGIPEMDRRLICPVRKELLLFVAPRKAGKTWFCVNLVKQAAVRRWKVLYVSLEISERIFMQRLYQSFFAVAKRGEEYKRMVMELDNDRGHMINLNVVDRKPKWHLEHPKIEKHLRANMKKQGLRLHSVLVKQFPTNRLTVRKFEAYLDQLEALENFIPDLVILDYPDLMDYDLRNPVIALGKVYEDFRGVLVERNMAGVAPTQGTREAEDVKKLKTKHVSRDISKIATCDNAIFYNATGAEKQFGLARLSSIARNDEAVEVLIEQDYATGQFVLRSSRLKESLYWDIFEDLSGKEGVDHADD